MNCGLEDESAETSGVESFAWGDLAERLEKVEAFFPIFGEKVGRRKTVLSVSGAGFFVSEHGDFLTAAHTLIDHPEVTPFYLPAPRLRVPKSKLARDGLSKSLIVKGVDKERDLLCGRVRGFGRSDPIPLADSEPEIGSPAMVVGFPHGQLLSDTGNAVDIRRASEYKAIVSAVACVGEERPFITVGNTVALISGFAFRFAAPPGMSGGPVINEAGALLGMVLQTQDEKYTICVGLRPLTGFLERQLEG